MLDLSYLDLHTERLAVIQYYTKYFLNIFTGTIEDSQHYREAQFITIWYLPINSLKWLSLQE
jgi:hypothetical protein